MATMANEIAATAHNQQHSRILTALALLHLSRSCAAAQNVWRNQQQKHQHFFSSSSLFEFCSMFWWYACVHSNRIFNDSLLIILNLCAFLLCAASIEVQLVSFYHILWDEKWHIRSLGRSSFHLHFLFTMKFTFDCTNSIRVWFDRLGKNEFLSWPFADEDDVNFVDWKFRGINCMRERAPSLQSYTSQWAPRLATAIGLTNERIGTTRVVAHRIGFFFFICFFFVSFLRIHFFFGCIFFFFFLALFFYCMIERTTLFTPTTTMTTTKKKLSFNVLRRSFVFVASTDNNH